MNRFKATVALLMCLATSTLCAQTNNPKAVQHKFADSLVVFIAAVKDSIHADSLLSANAKTSKSWGGFYRLIGYSFCFFDI